MSDYILIPDIIYKDASLSTWPEKVVFAKITSLAKSGECYASNKYFADILGMSESYVVKIISKLIRLNYIERDFVLEGKQIKKRVLKVINEVIYHSLPGGNPVGLEGGRPQSTPSRTRALEYRDLDIEYKKVFDECYDLYSYKKSRKAAEKAFAKIFKDCPGQVDPSFFDKIKEHIPKFIKTNYTDGTFPSRPYFSSYLNGEMWDDDIIEIKRELKPKFNSIDVLTPILREIRAVGTYGVPSFSKTELEAQRAVKQIGWGTCCSLSEFDLKMRVNKSMELAQ